MVDKNVQELNSKDIKFIKTPKEIVWNKGNKDIKPIISLKDNGAIEMVLYCTLYRDTFMYCNDSYTGNITNLVKLIGKTYNSRSIKEVKEALISLQDKDLISYTTNNKEYNIKVKIPDKDWFKLDVFAIDKILLYPYYKEKGKVLYLYAHIISRMNEVKYVDSNDNSEQTVNTTFITLEDLVKECGMNKRTIIKYLYLLECDNIIYTTNIGLVGGVNSVNYFTNKYKDLSKINDLAHYYYNDVLELKNNDKYKARLIKELDETFYDISREVEELNKIKNDTDLKQEQKILIATRDLIADSIAKLFVLAEKRTGRTGLKDEWDDYVYNLHCGMVNKSSYVNKLKLHYGMFSWFIKEEAISEYELLHCIRTIRGIMIKYELNYNM